MCAMVLTWSIEQTGCAILGTSKAGLCECVAILYISIKGSCDGVYVAYIVNWVCDLGHFH